MLRGSLEMGCFTFGILISRCDNPQPKVHRGGGSKLTIGAGTGRRSKRGNKHQATSTDSNHSRLEQNQGTKVTIPPFKPVSRRYFCSGALRTCFTGPEHGTRMDAVDAARMGLVLMA